MNALFALIPAPYQLLAKGVVALTLIIALYAAWNAFTGHYIDIGVQKQLSVDRENEKKAQEVKMAKESLAEVQRQSTLNELYDKQEESRKKYEATIADLRSDNRRMRVITAQPVNNLPSTQATSPGADKTCSVRLPAEIGESFARAKEQVEELAAKYKALQDIAIQDRKVCGASN